MNSATHQLLTNWKLSTYSERQDLNLTELGFKTTILLAIKIDVYNYISGGLILYDLADVLIKGTEIRREAKIT